MLFLYRREANCEFDRLLLSGGRIILEPSAASSRVANVSDMSMFDSMREMTGLSDRADAAKSSPQSSSFLDYSEVSLPCLKDLLIFGTDNGNFLREPRALSAGKLVCLGTADGFLRKSLVRITSELTGLSKPYESST